MEKHTMAMIGLLRDQQEDLRRMKRRIENELPYFRLMVKDLKARGALDHIADPEKKKWAKDVVSCLDGNLFKMDSADDEHFLKVELAEHFENEYEKGKHDGREAVGLIRRVIMLSGNNDLLLRFNELY